MNKAINTQAGVDNTHYIEHNKSVNDPEPKRDQPTRFQQAFCGAGNYTLKPLWHKIESAFVWLQSRLSNMLSKMVYHTQKENTIVPVGENSHIEKMLNDPNSFQVLPSMVVGLITSGTEHLNAGMGDLIKRQLLKNPNSTLFSRGNMALRRDDGVLKLIFADPKNLPLRDTAVKYELILDKRLGRPSNFDGSRIVEILKNQEFEFNSLSDFCRKMTMCEHLNFTQITTAEALATILTADPKHPIIYKPELVEQINMLVSQECGTQKYCSNHAFDIKKGIEYWTSSTVDTQESQPASWENTAGQRTVANMSEGKQQPDAGRRSTDNTPAGIISPSAMPRNAFGPLPLNPGANHPHQAQKAISELQTERSPNSNMNPHPIIVRDGANGSRDVVQPGSNANDKSKKPQIAPKPPGKLVGTQWSRGEVSGKK